MSMNQALATARAIAIRQTKYLQSHVKQSLTPNQLKEAEEFAFEQVAKTLRRTGMDHINNLDAYLTSAIRSALRIFSDTLATQSITPIQSGETNNESPPLRPVA